MLASGQAMLASAAARSELSSLTPPAWTFDFDDIARLAQCSAQYSVCWREGCQGPFR
jgi:hypothetical protein